MTTPEQRKSMIELFELIQHTPLITKNSIARKAFKKYARKLGLKVTPEREDIFARRNCPIL